MKDGIHPKYYSKAKISCACGAEFSVGSTCEKIQVEICSQCHPLFTGKEKLLDIAGRVDKFRERVAAAKKFSQVEKLKGEDVEREEQKKKPVKKLVIKDAKDKAK